MTTNKKLNVFRTHDSRCSACGQQVKVTVKPLYVQQRTLTGKVHSCSGRK